MRVARLIHPARAEKIQSTGLLLDDYIVQNPKFEDKISIENLVKQSFSGMPGLFCRAEDETYVSDILNHEYFSSELSWLVKSPNKSSIDAVCLVKRTRCAVDYISVIAVSPSRRRIGMGSLLLKKALNSSAATCSTSRYVVADVFVQNVQSLALFRSCGFIDVNSCRASFTEHLRKVPEAFEKGFV